MTSNPEVSIRPAPARPGLSGPLGWVWTVLAPFLGLIVTIALFAYLTRGSGAFLTVYNWRMIAVQTVIVATAALGMTLVMICGGIDLSVGSVVALVCVSMALATRGAEVVLPGWLGGGGIHLPAVPMGGALIVGLLVGTACGLVNGGLITGLGVVPFIITLGSLKMFRGLAKWLAGSTTVYAPAESKPWWFGRILAVEPTPTWLVVSPGVWLLAGLGLVFALALRYSVFGRHAYAIGSNESTARLCGINVPRTKLVVYALAGLAFGLAGLLQFVYVDGSGDPTTADGLELEVIAAVVIGGASLNGGEGTVLGTLIGCLIMSVLKNGCVLANIPNPVQDITIGAIIVVAVAVDRLRRREH